jgi:hypothetical protein
MVSAAPRHSSLRARNLSAAWQICGKFLVAAFFAEPRAATSPSPLRPNENLRKLLCRQFAARLLSAVDVRLGRNSGGALKPFPSLGILRRPVRCFARRALADAAQVPVGTQDFARM